LVLTLLLQIATSIPDMRDPIQSSRYLVPSVMLCLILILLSPTNWNRSPLWTIFIVLASTTTLLSSYNNYRNSDLSSAQALAQPGQVNPARTQLIALLRREGLEYGYATFWNAGSVSVLS